LNAKPAKDAKRIRVPAAHACLPFALFATFAFKA
jgi:hypothetical protein